MKLFASNRVEVLAQQLARVLEEPLSSPFVPEIVVVQSRGMERWLSMQLAGHHGICANTSFPFPNAAVHNLFRGVIKDVPEESLFDVDTMVWRIMEKLCLLMNDKGFESVRHYVSGDDTGIRLYQLSRELAQAFDQYVIFRDKAILDWQEHRFYFPEKDRNLEYWQSVLWRELAAGHEREHRASLKKAFVEMLGPEVIDSLPERLNIFGLSYVPLFHLEIFHAVSAYIPVNLFLMNPCCQYWGDIRSAGETAKILMKSPDKDEEALYLEEGNTLLASYGELGRQLFDVLQDFEIEEIDVFEETDQISMLACVQGDILNLQNPLSEEKRAVTRSDTSLQVHSCHSPMREVEVLHDNLLALFDENPGLRPEDIVVMTPDIETYAPFIQAVFDIDRKSPQYIPFSISDRTMRASSDLSDTFMAILDLADARFEASWVLSLLESESLRKKFCITDNDLETIQTWVQDTRICWGRDVQDKKELSLPGFAENTWRFGLERLILGYAMSPGKDREFEGILPYENMEGDDALILGNFISFVSALSERVRLLKQDRSLKDWSHILTCLLEGFFHIDEMKETDFRSVRSVLGSLAAIEERTGCHRALTLEVVRAYLGQRLEVKAEGMGFLVSGVTFCAMLPMRSIPFSAVCLLGMNHDSYPRQVRPRGFDLIANNPGKGDRNRRADDLYLFLEAVLSARKSLYISYIGQRIDTNAEVPPSVLVSGLLDYIEQGYAMEDGSPLKDHVFTAHALQAFNPRYFTAGSRVFSFSEENAHAAKSLVDQDRLERIFWAGSLGEPGQEWRMVDIDMLCDFYANPARFLLKNRLGVIFPSGAISLDDREPFDLDALQYYTLSQEHIRNVLGGMGRERSRRLFRMSGQLPHGEPGDAIFRKIDDQTEIFTQIVKRSCQGCTEESVIIDLSIGDFAITGTIPTYGRSRMVRFRHASLKGSDLVRTWIAHLVLCAAGLNPDTVSMCIAKDVTATFVHTRACRDILAILLDRYWQGLMRPLHFFPEASWKFVDPGKNRDKSPKDPMNEARKVWRGGINPARIRTSTTGSATRGSIPLMTSLQLSRRRSSLRCWSMLI